MRNVAKTENGVDGLDIAALMADIGARGETGLNRACDRAGCGENAGPAGGCRRGLGQAVNHYLGQSKRSGIRAREKSECCDAGPACYWMSHVFRGS